MKLYNIVNYFGRMSSTEEEKLGDRVFKKVSNFNRKAQMIPSIMTMRELNKAFEEERNAKAVELIESFCREQNTANKGKEGYESLELGKNINTVPPPKIPEFQEWYKKRILTEIDSIAPIKFLPEEIEAADRDSPIDPELLIGFSDFYDPKEMSAYVKNKGNDKAKIEKVLPESK